MKRNHAEGKAQTKELTLAIAALATRCPSTSSNEIAGSASRYWPVQTTHRLAAQTSVSHPTAEY